MPTCASCGIEFPNKINIDGQTYNLAGRKFCTNCSPVGGKNTRSYIIKLNENEAFCARCQKIKNANEFYKRKSNGRPFSYCIVCQEEVKTIKFDEKLENIIQNYGGVCHDCKVLLPATIYEFYKDGNLFPIHKIKNMSLQRIIKDLEGYIMLCRNCRALRYWEINQNSL